MQNLLCFEPFLRPMVWGSRRLEGFLKRALPGVEPYGEAWQVSDHPLHQSVVRAGPFAGQTLRMLMENHAEDLLGRSAHQYPRFPWLVKFLDAADWLSIQVHPDEQVVRRWLPGEGSKTEAWFVLDAASGSRIYAGLLPGVGPAELRAAIQSGRASECLHSFEPRPGDCVFLPAGTVHAVGRGVLLAEVQQTSDATFRIFDWNRKDAQGKGRTLHIEESLACIHWDAGPVKRRHVPFGGEVATNRRFPLVECPYFVLEYVEAVKPVALAAAGRLRLLLMIGGAGRLEAKDSSLSISQGDAVIVPASLADVKCSPEPFMQILTATLP